jgi:hypothetical protein
MAVDRTSDGLVASVKIQGMLADGMFTDDEILDAINDSYMNDTIPFYMKHREDYFVEYVDYTYANSIPIPEAALGGKLKDVVRISTDGKYRSNLPRFSAGEMSGADRGWYRSVGFYLEGNNVKFFPEDVITENIRISYFARPTFLELTSLCSLVVSVTGAVCTVTSVPTAWTSATEIDVVSSTYPYTPSTNKTIVSVDSTTQITLSASGAVAGDYICPKGYTVYLGIPYECQEVLTQASLMRLMISIKDMNGYKLHKETWEGARENLAVLLSPRVECEVKKIANHSGIWSKSNRSRNYRGW